MFKNISICCAGFLLVSCTWVKVTNEGESVMVRNADQVADCTKVARTTASLRSKVMGVERSKEKVQKELETLARNAAVDYGGNVVVPTSEITDGKQTFDVYKCP
jgi:heterodisulfide reductase subunit B